MAPKCRVIRRIWQPGDTPGEGEKRTISVLESSLQEVASFGIGITIIEPGGARTEFHNGGARVAKLMPIYQS